MITLYLICFRAFVHHFINIQVAYNYVVKQVNYLIFADRNSSSLIFCHLRTEKEKRISLSLWRLSTQCSLKGVQEEILRVSCVGVKSEYFFPFIFVNIFCAYNS